MFFLPFLSSPHPVPYVFGPLAFEIFYWTTFICYYNNSRSEFHLLCIHVCSKSHSTYHRRDKINKRILEKNTFLWTFIKKFSSTPLVKWYLITGLIHVQTLRPWLSCGYSAANLLPTFLLCSSVFLTSFKSFSVKF